MRGVGGTTGVGLVEVYDLDQAADSELANISTRGFVDTEDNIMIGGFIIGPEDLGDTTVMVRAIGPSLGDFGVIMPSRIPSLSARRQRRHHRDNDNWRDDQESEITEDRSHADRRTRSPPSLQTLAAGGYTAIVRGVADTTGVGLVEVYRLQ